MTEESMPLNAEGCRSLSDFLMVHQLLLFPDNSADASPPGMAVRFEGERPTDITITSVVPDSAYRLGGRFRALL